MTPDDKLFTVREAEFLAGYVYGSTLVALGLIGDINKFTAEQEQSLLKFIESGMQLLGQKSSLQIEGEAELRELLGE